MVIQSGRCRSQCSSGHFILDDAVNVDGDSGVAELDARRAPSRSMPESLCRSRLVVFFIMLSVVAVGSGSKKRERGFLFLVGSGQNTRDQNHKESGQRAMYKTRQITVPENYLKLLKEKF